jgi:hypothetical protein
MIRLEHQNFLQCISQIEDNKTYKECLKKLTHSEPEEIETAESKSEDPKGPTFAFSTCSPSYVRSNLMALLFPNKPTA